MGRGMLPTCLNVTLRCVRIQTLFNIREAKFQTGYVGPYFYGANKEKMGNSDMECFFPSVCGMDICIPSCLPDISELCISQLKSRPPSPRDIAGLIGAIEL